jgi:hypothetical protein
MWPLEDFIFDDSNPKVATKPKHHYSVSKVRGRPDGKTLSAFIPIQIVHAMRLREGDSIEWIG